MKVIWLLSILGFISISVNGQTNLKKIILNKKQKLDSNWVTQIQEKGEWEFVKTVRIRGKKVKDAISLKDGQKWRFKKDSLEILPYYFKTDSTIFLNVSIQYYELNKTFETNFKTTFRGRPLRGRHYYKVISLMDDYLVIERVENDDCFDYSEVRVLTDKECKEKEEAAKKAPKRLFRGKEIRLGRKPSKYRLVFRVKR